jgi:hypothetical protein
MAQGRVSRRLSEAARDSVEQAAHRQNSPGLQQQESEGIGAPL